MQWTDKTVKGLRDHLGLNQSDFAEALGFSRYQTVGEIESGKRSITDTVSRLLDYMAREAGYGQGETADVPDRLDALASEAQSIARQMRGEQ